MLAIHQGGVLKCFNWGRVWIQPLSGIFSASTPGPPCNVIIYICSSTQGLYITLLPSSPRSSCLFVSNMPAQRTEQGSSHVDISIATEPNDIEAIPTLLKEITQAFDTFTTSNAGREDLLAKCRTLVQALETPRETMIYHCWAHASTPP